MGFKVVKSGFLSIIQDYGRLGYGGQGLVQSGVMDEHAYAWSNRLLDNHFNDATIEITFGSFALKAKTNTFIAVTGADLDFKINNNPALMWRHIQVKNGDILTWDKPKKYGVRAYLAVKGGFDTQVFFSSRSVNLREHIGDKLNKDDTLPCASFNAKIHCPPTPEKYIPNYNQPLILRLLPSYQFNQFSASQHNLLFNQNYTISHANDRVGCRLDGAPMNIKKSTMISEGISYGSVEIATDGLPIILLKDAPTIGGYAKIGTVFSLDLAKLAQRQAGTKLRFEIITIHQAQKKRQQFNNFFTITPH